MGLLPDAGAMRHDVHGGHADPPLHCALAVDDASSADAAATNEAAALTATPPA
ncbi:MAG: hypothetical protein U0326_38335 [Polyangiales bacterium]